MATAPLAGNQSTVNGVLQEETLDCSPPLQRRQDEEGAAAACVWPVGNSMSVSPRAGAHQQPFAPSSLPYFPFDILNPSNDETATNPNSNDGRLRGRDSDNICRQHYDHQQTQARGREQDGRREHQQFALAGLLSPEGNNNAFQAGQGSQDASSSPSAAAAASALQAYPISLSSSGITVSQGQANTVPAASGSHFDTLLNNSGTYPTGYGRSEDDDALLYGIDPNIQWFASPGSPVTPLTGAFFQNGGCPPEAAAASSSGPSTSTTARLDCFGHNELGRDLFEQIGNIGSGARTESLVGQEARQLQSLGRQLESEVNGGDGGGSPPGTFRNQNEAGTFQISGSGGGPFTSTTTVYSSRLRNDTDINTTYHSANNNLNILATAAVQTTNQQAQNPNHQQPLLRQSFSSSVAEQPYHAATVGDPTDSILNIDDFEFSPLHDASRAPHRFPPIQTSIRQPLPPISHLHEDFNSQANDASYLSASYLDTVTTQFYNSNGSGGSSDGNSPAPSHPQPAGSDDHRHLPSLTLYLPQHRPTTPDDVIMPPSRRRGSSTSVTMQSARRPPMPPMPASNAGSSTGVTVPGNSRTTTTTTSSSRKRDSGVAGLEGTTSSASKRKRARTGCGSGRAGGGAAQAGSSSPLVQNGVREIPAEFDDFNDSNQESEDEVFDLTKGLLPEFQTPKKQGEKVKLSQFQCAICMDHGTALTVTHCGHLFCGECLTSALAVENQKNKCPICRQKIEHKPSTKNMKGYYPLELKLMVKKGKRLGGISKR